MNAKSDYKILRFGTIISNFSDFVGEIIACFAKLES